MIVNANFLCDLCVKVELLAFKIGRSEIGLSGDRDIVAVCAQPQKQKQTAAGEPPFGSSTCPESSTVGAEFAVGGEAVVPLGAGPRSSRDISVPVED